MSNSFLTRIGARASGVPRSIARSQFRHGFRRPSITRISFCMSAWMVNCTSGPVAPADAVVYSDAAGSTDALGDRVAADAVSLRRINPTGVWALDRTLPNPTPGNLGIRQRLQYYFRPIQSNGQGEFTLRFEQIINCTELMYFQGIWRMNGSQVTIDLLSGTTTGPLLLIGPNGGSFRPCQPDLPREVDVSHYNYNYGHHLDWRISNSQLILTRRADPAPGEERAELTLSPMDCQEGTMDCDGIRENGCEAALASDPRNCGRCSDFIQGVILGGRGQCPHSSVHGGYLMCKMGRCETE